MGGASLFQSGQLKLPKEADRSPLPLREYLSELPRDSYVVVRIKSIGLELIKTNSIVQGGEEF